MQPTTPNSSIPADEPIPGQPATVAQSSPVEKTLHCVKCHCDYTPSENAPDACQIEHDENNMDAKHENGGYRYTLPCCGLSVWDESDDGPHEDWEPEMCFVGAHSAEHEFDEVGQRVRYSGAGYCSDCDTDEEDDDDDEDEDADGETDDEA
ncbi:hypothetical protein C8R45DRAFT_1213695 [Mycena sanguinolenta]|nr:hypothetical protein C8R45DRAFT_1213695 [Mycena sanguinolenta]